MITIFCTWDRRKQRWKFRELVSPYNIKAQTHRIGKFRQLPKAMVRIPSAFLDLIKSKRKRRSKVAEKFYEMQAFLGLPRFPS